jgi:hypothetical protein
MLNTTFIGRQALSEQFIHRLKAIVFWDAAQCNVVQTTLSQVFTAYIARATIA